MPVLPNPIRSKPRKLTQDSRAIHVRCSSKPRNITYEAAVSLVLSLPSTSEPVVMHAAVPSACLSEMRTWWSASARGICRVVQTACKPLGFATRTMAGTLPGVQDISTAHVLGVGPYMRSRFKAVSSHTGHGEAVASSSLCNSQTWSFAATLNVLRQRRRNMCRWSDCARTGRGIACAGFPSQVGEAVLASRPG